MKYQYTHCRAMGHAWDQIPADRRPPWGTLMVFRCTRCATTRDDIIDVYGELSSRSYDHPDGYKLDEPKTRADFRFKMMKERPAFLAHGDSIEMPDLADRLGRNLYTFGIRYDDGTLEEIDVRADRRSEARSLAFDAMKRYYQPGGELVDMDAGGTAGVVYIERAS